MRYPMVKTASLHLFWGFPSLLFILFILINDCMMIMLEYYLIIIIIIITSLTVK